jgi:hypothetical protein
MSKFDLVYEKLYCQINEKEYVDSTFQDNLLLLVKMLKDNDYLPATKQDELYVREILSQNNNVKEIVLDTQEKSLPPIKLRVKQDDEVDSESLSVTVINLEKPEEQKEFNNSMLETIFSDVSEYIKTIALQGMKPEAAVETLPQEQNPANQQPGGGESQLPKV